jgi:hypothetical protein
MSQVSKKCDKVENHYGSLGWYRLECKDCRKPFGTLFIQDIGYGDNGLIEFTCNSCIEQMVLKNISK